MTGGSAGKECAESTPRDWPAVSGLERQTDTDGAGGGRSRTWAAPGGRRSRSGERRPFAGGGGHCWQGAYSTGQDPARHSPGWHGTLPRGHRGHGEGTAWGRSRVGPGGTGRHGLGPPTAQDSSRREHGVGTLTAAEGRGQEGGCVARGRSVPTGTPQGRAVPGEAARAQAEQGSAGDRLHGDRSPARAALGDTRGTGQRRSGTLAAQGCPRPRGAVPTPGRGAQHGAPTRRSRSRGLQ